MNVPAAAVSMFSDETPDWVKNGQNRGSEEVGTKDLMLPRLEIVQSESPIKDVNPDATDGVMFNTVTQEVLGDEVYVVPIYYRMEYLVWKDKDAGGGFMGAFDSMDEAEDRKAEAVRDGEKPEMIEINDTPVHYCLLVQRDAAGAFKTQQIVISMPKSKAKVSRKWNAVIQICGGDRFSRVYKITTFKDKNKAGKSFQNYVVQPAGFTPEAIFRETERLYGVIRSEGIRANHESAGPATEGGEPDGEI